jgi:hypothetical protein
MTALMRMTTWIGLYMRCLAEQAHYAGCHRQMQFTSALIEFFVTEALYRQLNPDNESEGEEKLPPAKNTQR